VRQGHGTGGEERLSSHKGGVRKGANNIKRQRKEKGQTIELRRVAWNLVSGLYIEEYFSLEERYR